MRCEVRNTCWWLMDGGWWLVDHAIHEPRPFVVRVGDSIRGAVTQCHIPLVAIPQVLPPISGRAPWTFAPLDAATGDTAAIGRHTSRAALFNNDARRNRIAKTAQYRRWPCRSSAVIRPAFARRVEFRHREGAWPIGVDERGRADMVAAHQRTESRDERRQRVTRQRARE